MDEGGHERNLFGDLVAAAVLDLLAVLGNVQRHPFAADLIPDSDNGIGSTEIRPQPARHDHSSLASPYDADWARPASSQSRRPSMVSRCETDSGTWRFREAETSSVVNSRPALKPIYMASMLACSISPPT